MTSHENDGHGRAVKETSNRTLAAAEELGILIGMEIPACPKCGGTIHNLADRFCRRCGEDLNPQHTKCGSCGFSAIIPDGMAMNYCPMCSAVWPQSQASRGLNTGGKTTVLCD